MTPLVSLVVGFGLKDIRLKGCCVDVIESYLHVCYHIG